MNKVLLGIPAVALFAASTPSYAQQATAKEQLLKATSGDKVSYSLGEQPADHISVTPTRLWLMFVDSTRKTPAAAALTDAEAIASMKSNVAWTGKYSTDDRAC